MDLNLPPQINRVTVLSLAVIGILLFCFGAPKSAGLQVVGTLMLVSSCVLLVLPKSREKRKERKPFTVSKFRKLLGIAFCGYLLWCIGAPAFQSARDVDAGIAEQTWETTEATVLSSVLVERKYSYDSRWYGLLTYSYTVDGRSYVGTDHDLYFTSPPSPDIVKKARPPGYRMPVYYDANNPIKSVLHRKSLLPARLFVSILSTIFFVLAVFCTSLVLEIFGVKVAPDRSIDERI